MESFSIKQHIRTLISQGKIEQAFKDLSKYDDNTIVLLYSRYNSVKRNMNLGIVSQSDSQMEINRINAALLSILDTLESSDDSNSFSTFTKKDYSNNISRNDSNANGRILKVFYSYAHTDNDYLSDLQKHLKVLEKMGKIKSWHDREILPGDEWSEEIIGQLKEADIILFLVSADFLASDYIWRKEIDIAMERRSKGKAIVVPIILKPCLWKQTEFANLQALPLDRQGRLTPISKWDDRDEAMSIVADGLNKLIDAKSF